MIYIANWNFKYEAANQLRLIYENPRIIFY